MASETKRPLAVLFGGRVAEKRKVAGLSQEDLAEKVGISQESLSRMEKGVIAPKFERLQLFADALNCKVSDLFIEKFEPSETSRAIESIIAPLKENEQKEVIEVVSKISNLLTRK